MSRNAEGLDHDYHGELGQGHGAVLLMSCDDPFVFPEEVLKFESLVLVDNLTLPPFPSRDLHASCTE